MEKPIYPIHDSPILHKVCYLGCAQHVKLLMKVGQIKVIRPRNSIIASFARNFMSENGMKLFPHKSEREGPKKSC